MKPQLLKVPAQPLGSFSVRKDLYPNINSRWHYHPEIELIHIHAGSGMQFIGDTMRAFHPGDIVLVGSNLPHYWRFDQFAPAKKKITYSTVIHFLENAWGENFINLPETRLIKSVLEKAKRGILIHGDDSVVIGKLIERVHRSEGLQRLMALLQTLQAIYESKQQVVLSSAGFKYAYSTSEDERIHNVYEYTLQHANGKIELEQIASIAGLVENSFCRYFKSRTGKTYSQFLTEIRVGQACKHLMEDRMTIKQICFASGFNNFSCFFNKFKEVTGKTPLKYKQEIN